MATVYAYPCPHDPGYACHIGCKELSDKPWWCIYKLDLYQKKLEELARREKEKPVVITVDVKPTSDITAHFRKEGEEIIVEFEPDISSVLDFDIQIRTKQEPWVEVIHNGTLYIAPRSVVEKEIGKIGSTSLINY